MRTKSLGRAVGADSYPGRGIVVGKSADGKKAVFAYFIMGRSANSRSRVFAEYGDEVRAEPLDKSGENPDLIYYSPVQTVGRDIAVANGDHADDIARALREGRDMRQALSSRTFEPDAPHYTPRIGAALHLGRRPAEFRYEMAILKCADRKGKRCERQFFCYEPVSGVGHFLHTYQKNASPLPAFEGEPVRVKLGSDIHEIADEIWENLDGDNKIALYCRAVDLKTGQTACVLYNKYQRR